MEVEEARIVIVIRAEHRKPVVAGMRSRWETIPAMVDAWQEDGILIRTSHQDTFHSVQLRPYSRTVV